jgi:hypothetical protein
VLTGPNALGVSVKSITGHAKRMALAQLPRERMQGVLGACLDGLREVFRVKLAFSPRK